MERGEDVSENLMPERERKDREESHPEERQRHHDPRWMLPLLQQCPQDLELAPGREARPSGLSERVPSARKLPHVRARATAVGRQHRADPPSPVGVGAHYQLIVLDGGEHRAAGRAGSS